MSYGKVSHKFALYFLIFTAIGLFQSRLYPKAKPNLILFQNVY